MSRREGKVFRGSLIVTQLVLVLGMDVLAIVDHDIRGKWDGRREDEQSSRTGRSLSCSLYYSC